MPQEKRTYRVVLSCITSDINTEKAANDFEVFFSNLVRGKAAYGMPKNVIEVTDIEPLEPCRLRPAADAEGPDPWRFEDEASLPCHEAAQAGGAR